MVSLPRTHLAPVCAPSECAHRRSNAKQNKWLADVQLSVDREDSSLPVAIFWSAHWFSFARESSFPTITYGEFHHFSPAWNSGQHV